MNRVCSLPRSSAGIASRFLSPKVRDVAVGYTRVGSVPFMLKRFTQEFLSANLHVSHVSLVVVAVGYGVLQVLNGLTAAPREK